MVKKAVRYGLFLCVCAVTISALVSSAFGDPSRNKDIGSSQAAKLVQDTVKKYFIQDKNASITTQASEESGLYKVDVGMANITQAFYLTKDGSRIIFPDGIVSIAKLEESAKKETVKQQHSARLQKTPACVRLCFRHALSAIHQ